MSCPFCGILVSRAGVYNFILGKDQTVNVRLSRPCSLYQLLNSIVTAKAAVDNMSMNGSDCIPIKQFIKPVAGQTFRP